jgi:hypothetical protein
MVFHGPIDIYINQWNCQFRTTLGQSENKKTDQPLIQTN